jgi:Na+-translocating ferredoxin:NAD+ oxidoreductase RnfA subunit
MNIILYILVIAALVQIVEITIKRTNINLYNSLGIFLTIDYYKLCSLRYCPHKYK